MARAKAGRGRRGSVAKSPAKSGPGAAAKVAAAESSAQLAAAEQAAEPATQSAEGVVRLGIIEARVCREWEGESALTELPKALARRPARLWVDVCEGTPELKSRVAAILGFHPLLAEDIAERDQRAKIEQVGDLLHLVMFSLGFDDGEIYERELDFVLGERFLLTNHSKWWDPRATRHLRSRSEEHTSELQSRQ